MRRWLISAVAFVIGTVTLAGMMSGCGSNKPEIGGSGMLEADEAIVSAETGGRVRNMQIAEGSSVRVGDTLLVIDPSRVKLELASTRAGRDVIKSRLNAARLQLQQAKESERYANREFQRVLTLVNSGTATQQSLDQLEHELAVAELTRQSAETRVQTVTAELAKLEADIERIERQLQDCYPLAPVDGIVTDRFIEPGELLTAGRPIAKISRMDTLWVHVYVPTSDFARVKVGDGATVDVESGLRTYQGQVVWTSAEAEFTPKNVQTKKSRANLVYAVKVRVANTDSLLKVGMPVYVTIDR